MKCPECKADTKVINSRMKDDIHITRRRECKECRARFWTVEMYEWEFLGDPEPDYTEIRKEIKIREQRKYCNGDNCLTCKYETCKLDEPPKKRTGRPKKEKAILRESAWRLLK